MTWAIHSVTVQPALKRQENSLLFLGRIFSGFLREISGASGIDCPCNALIGFVRDSGVESRATSLSSEDIGAGLSNGLLNIRRCQ